MTLYFSRLALNREASARALLPLLNPTDPGKAADAHHRLIWNAFSDSAERDRDFLWRYDGQGRFFTLSARPPRSSDLFQPPECKEFDPDLRVGDRLTFTLRANATRDRAAISRMAPEARRGKDRRVDVVMDLLRHVAPGPGRAEARDVLAQTAAEAWMARQGASKGFASRQTVVESYTTLELGRNRRSGATFGLLDLAGEIEVTDPVLFLSAMAAGFGRAKAWGCGLMLIRRAR